MNSPPAVSPLMAEVSAYIAGAAKRTLPADVVEKGKHHILDTLATMVSGSRLLPGKNAIAYVKTLGGPRQACVIGTSIVTSAINAALANGMFAHADETDDIHQAANMHPGASIVPAALAMAERERRDGSALLRAVVTGYDIGCRVTRVMHPEAFRAAGRANQSFGGVFGAATAAGVVARFDARRVRYLLSYTAQLASGIRTMERDSDHILKAFVFGGMTGRHGVEAASMVACGFTGVEDEFSGSRNRNFFSAFCPDPNPAEMTRELGKTFEVMNTNIKKWPVGSPVQSALESLFALVNEHKIAAGDVEKVVIETPDNEWPIVNNSGMVDVNMQHLIAVSLLDGRLTFNAAHDSKRMKHPKVVEFKKRIELIASPYLTAARPARQCIMRISTRDGRKLKHHTYAVRGTADNPMTREEVADKAYNLAEPVLGKHKAQALIRNVLNLEKLGDIRSLRVLLRK